MTEDKIDLDDIERRTSDIIILWIGLIISLIGIVGIIATTILETDDTYFRIMLAVFILGVLVIGFGLIIRRLRRKGIEDFALGAVTAFLGFILLSLPVILYSANVQITLWKYIIIIASGLFLIIFGYAMEVYDLNIKFLNLMIRLKDALKLFLQRINWKLVLSPWNLLTLAGLTIIILTAVGILHQIESLWFYLIGGALILINIIYHFRKEFLELFKTIGRILETIFRAWWRLLKQVPRLIKRFILWIYDPERFKRIMRWIWDKIKWVGRAIKYVFVRNYFILFVFGVVIGFLLPKTWAPEIRFAIASLVCLVAVVKPILEWREHFGEELSSARLFLYKTSHKVRTRIRRETFANCPHCNFRTTKTALECWNCGNQIPRCMICYNRVEVETEVVKCANCENIYHEDHLKTWMRFNRKCPVCKEEIKETKTEILSITSEATSQAN